MICLGKKFVFQEKVNMHHQKYIFPLCFVVSIVNKQYQLSASKSLLL